MSPSLPEFLLDIPRNPVVAVGLPLALGFLSGARTKKVINGIWYKVDVPTLGTTSNPSKVNNTLRRALYSLPEDPRDPRSQ